MKDYRGFEMLIAIAVLMVVLVGCGSGLAAASAEKVAEVYYYLDKDNAIAFSKNNFVVQVGQKLVIRRESSAPVELRDSRFMSSAGNENFYDVFKIEESINYTGTEKGALHDGAVFTAVKPGVGKLQVVPNYSDWDRARFLIVTVRDNES